MFLYKISSLQATENCQQKNSLGSLSREGLLAGWEGYLPWGELEGRKDVFFSHHLLAGVLRPVFI